jgi:peptidoglycan/xylan/chitin deacetylase (PgdA/CDA1 family)
LFVFKIPLIIKWFYPTLVWNGERTSKTIYLTFDDGPVPGVTDCILDVLAEHQVKASFFCVGGNIAKNPELFKSIIREGHTVGNHTYHHLNGWNQKEEDYINDINKCREVMIQCGYSSDIRLFRPPYGRLKKKVISRIGKDYRIIMWDVLSWDFSSRLSSKKILRKSIRHTEGGSIIIFHDSEKTKSDIRFIISQYIDHFCGLNYEFSTIDELFLLN